jgi:hypothetical protein
MSARRFTEHDDRPTASQAIREYRAQLQARR